MAVLAVCLTLGLTYEGAHNRGHSSDTLTARPATTGSSSAAAAPTVPPSASATPSPSYAPPDPVADEPTEPPTVPTVGVGEHPKRLLPVPTPPAGAGGYAFLKDADTGRPPQYDPCRPIHYVVRDKNTPIGGDDAISTAVAAISKATGLEFIDDGKTTEAPNWERLNYQPSRYGDRWAPVLIAWTDASEVPNLEGDAGRGGSVSFTPVIAEAPVYVTGEIALNAPSFQQMGTWQNGNILETEIIEHELGHLVGLDHVSDTTQIMSTNIQTLTGYGAGDLRGLAIAGSGACHPEL